MKTVISIPDKIFASTERLARRLGLSRSELYVAALKEYLERHQGYLITERLNALYGETSPRLDSSLAAMQTRALPKGRW